MSVYAFCDPQFRLNHSSKKFSDLFVLVPMNTMCSKKCDNPWKFSGSERYPTETSTAQAAVFNPSFAPSCSSSESSEDNTSDPDSSSSSSDSVSSLFFPSAKSSPSPPVFVPNKLLSLIKRISKPIFPSLLLLLLLFTKVKRLNFRFVST